jgi:hypothetical protein
MLDRLTSALLQTINDNCDFGKYEIFSEEDFLASFPKEWEVTSDMLNQMLSQLSENGYIKVKYADRGMYCLSPLPLGRGYYEQETERRDDRLSLFKYSLAAAFLGGAAGSLFGAILFALLFFLVR